MAIVNSFLAASLDIIGVILNLYVWLLIIGAVISWLVAFDVINTRNRFVQTINDMIYRLTEPALRPIRRILPTMGGLDLSPLVLIFIIMFLQRFLGHLVISL